MLAVCQAVLSATSGLAFRQCNTDAMTLLVKTAVGRAVDLPNEHQVRRAIDACYETALLIMEERLHRARSFSIAFDCWTTKSLLESFVGIVYTYVNEKFQVALGRVFGFLN